MEEVEFKNMTVYSTFTLEPFFEEVKKQHFARPYFAIQSMHDNGVFVGYKCVISSRPVKWHSATSTWQTID